MSIQSRQMIKMSKERKGWICSTLRALTEHLLRTDLIACFIILLDFALLKFTLILTDSEEGTNYDIDMLDDLEGMTFVNFTQMNSSYIPWCAHGFCCV